MPVNMLHKDTPKGEKPPGWAPSNETEANKNTQNEEDLAAIEQEAIWHADEVGNVKWSGQDGKRYGD